MTVPHGDKGLCLLLINGYVRKDEALKVRSLNGADTAPCLKMSLVVFDSKNYKVVLVAIDF